MRRIFKKVRFDRHLIYLIAIYSLGLRLQEGTHLQVSDIDSDRMFIHIHRGKGNSRSDPYREKIATFRYRKEHWSICGNSGKHTVILFCSFLHPAVVASVCQPPLNQCLKAAYRSLSGKLKSPQAFTNQYRFIILDTHMRSILWKPG